jgi:hypothetical protein
MVGVATRAAARACPRRATDHNLQVVSVIGKRAFEALKLLKTTTIAVSTLTFAVYAITKGADASIVAPMALVVVLGVGGWELSEIAAIRVETDDQQQEDRN